MLKFGNCGKLDTWAIHCQCKSVLLFTFVSSAVMLLWSEIRGCASSSLSSPHKIAVTLFAQDYDFITHHKHVQHAVSVSHRHVLKVYKLVLSNSYIDVTSSYLYLPHLVHTGLYHGDLEKYGWKVVVATKFSVKHQGKVYHHPPSTIHKWPFSDLPGSTPCPSLSLSFTIWDFGIMIYTFKQSKSWVPI